MPGFWYGMYSLYITAAMRESTMPHVARLVRVLRASDQSALASKVAGALSPAVSLASSSYASAKAVASQLAQLTRALAQAQTG